ncbi:MAG: hypothetical protein IKJ65_02065 [Clostridia bacterium]|nr:hypothetical protein [Clostridia bacterium]
MQGINTLYSSRVLRFDDCFFEQFVNAFQLDREKQLRILEIGCGPGAPAGAMHRWYPKEEIAKMTRLANQKYDRRIQKYLSGEKEWDTTVSVTMIARGVKE